MRPGQPKQFPSWGPAPASAGAELARCGAGDYQRSSSRRHTTSGLLLRLLLGKFGESGSLAVGSTGFCRKFWRGSLLLRRWVPRHARAVTVTTPMEAPGIHRSRRPPVTGERPRSVIADGRLDPDDRRGYFSVDRTSKLAGGKAPPVGCPARWLGAIAQRPVHAHLNDDSKPAIPPNPIPPSPSPKSEPSNIDHPVGSRPASASRR